GPRRHSEPAPAALGDHRHRSGLERGEPRSAAEADTGIVFQVEDAETVRTHHANARLACGGRQSGLEAFAFLARFGEATGEDDRKRNPRLPALPYGAFPPLPG